ncbi:MAG: efflux RND transporter periplasmic adaptor subunit [Anaerolineae bacterium]|nr:efflux RND transporter periplasmic adaptor subunit [Anaerolineae bacterium]
MKWRLLTIVLLVLSLAVGCGPKPQEESTPTPIPTSKVPDKPTYVVSRGLVENKEQFTARVSPVNEEGLYFKKSGYVKVAYADRGDWVEEGTLLAELEIDDLLNQLALAELDLEGAQKQYSLAEEAHQRQLYSAGVSLQKLQLQLARARLQTPIEDYTSLQNGVDQAKESLEEAKVAYAEALDRPWEPQRIRDSLLKNIAKAERSYEEAQARYTQAVLRAKQAEQVRAIDLQLLEMELEKAEQELVWLEKGVDPSLVQRVDSNQLKVDRLLAEIETAQLIAPFDGEITSFSVIPGNAVEARKKVAVIADPNTWDITADLTTSQLSLFEEGQPGEITMSSVPGKIFPALLRQLPYPYGTGGGEAKVEDADERVHVSLLNPEEVDLEVGDLVRVTVLIERSEDALWLPPAAIRTFEGRKFVMVREGDRLLKRDIKLGIEGEDRVEILGGLEEDQVIEGL